MNDNVRKMVKNVIEENAVDFKKATSKALYEKIGDRLKQEYVAVSQNLLKKKLNENVTAVSAPPSSPLPGGGSWSPSPAGYPNSPEQGPPNIVPRPGYVSPFPGRPGERRIEPTFIPGDRDTFTDENGYVWRWDPSTGRWIISEVPPQFQPRPGYYSDDDLKKIEDEYPAPDWEPGSVDPDDPALPGPNPQDYWPGGFGPTTAPERGDYPPGPEGEQQWREAKELYDQRFSQYKRDLEEYRKYLDQRSRQRVEKYKRGMPRSRQKPRNRNPGGGGSASITQ